MQCVLEFMMWIVMQSFCLCIQDGGGGLIVDGRPLVVCQAMSRDAVQLIASQKTEVTDCRNLHLVRESCM